MKSNVIKVTAMTVVIHDSAQVNEQKVRRIKEYKKHEKYCI